MVPESAKFLTSQFLAGEINIERQEPTVHEIRERDSSIQVINHWDWKSEKLHAISEAIAETHISTMKSNVKNIILNKYGCYTIVPATT